MKEQMNNIIKVYNTKVGTFTMHLTQTCTSKNKTPDTCGYRYYKGCTTCKAYTPILHDDYGNEVTIADALKKAYYGRAIDIVYNNVRYQLPRSSRGMLGSQVITTAEAMHYKPWTTYRDAKVTKKLEQKAKLGQAKLLTSDEKLNIIKSFNEEQQRKLQPDKDISQKIVYELCRLVKAGKLPQGLVKDYWAMQQKVEAEHIVSLELQSAFGNDTYKKPNGWTKDMLSEQDTQRIKAYGLSDMIIPQLNFKAYRTDNIGVVEGIPQLTWCPSKKNYSSGNKSYAGFTEEYAASKALPYSCKKETWVTYDAPIEDDIAYIQYVTSKSYENHKLPMAPGWHSCSVCGNYFNEGAGCPGHVKPIHVDSYNWVTKNEEWNIKATVKTSKLAEDYDSYDDYLDAEVYADTDYDDDNYDDYDYDAE